MNDDDFKKWLIDLARSATSTKNGEIFTSKLLYKQLNMANLEKFAQELYVENASLSGKVSNLSYSDLVVFTFLVMAVVYKNNGYTTKTTKNCQSCLKKTVFQYDKTDHKAQERLAKCLLEAANQIRP